LTTKNTKATKAGVTGGQSPPAAFGRAVENEGRQKRMGRLNAHPIHF